MGSGHNDDQKILTDNVNANQNKDNEYQLTTEIDIKAEYIEDNTDDFDSHLSDENVVKNPLLLVTEESFEAPLKQEIKEEIEDNDIPSDPLYLT